MVIQHLAYRLERKIHIIPEVNKSDYERLIDQD